MGEILITAGECVVSNRSGDVLKAVSLGSGLAIIIIASESHAAGMLHTTLPDSAISPMSNKPGLFIDSGIPCLLDMMQQDGLNLENGIRAKLVGGAGMLLPNQIFDIGQRNIDAARQVLSTYITVSPAEDVGGFINRTVTVNIDTGEVTVTSPGRGRWRI